MNFSRRNLGDFFGGLLFFCFSVFFFTLIAQDKPVRAYATLYTGRETPCEITEASVRENNTNGLRHEAAVRFLYRVGDRAYEGEWTSAPMRTEAEAQPALDAVLAQAKDAPRCHVNPDAPGEAVLHADFPWRNVGAALFISIFCALGVRLMLQGLGKAQDLKNTFVFHDEKKAGRIAGLILGVPFASVGYLMLYSMWSSALSRPDLSTWVETPGAVEAAAIHRTTGKGAHDELELRYSYHIADRIYFGHDIRPGIATERVAGREDPLVLRYAKGAPITCRVDPNNPSRSTLLDNPDDTGERVMGTVFFGLFAGVGTMMTAGGVVGSRLKPGKAAQKWITGLFCAGVAAVFITAAIVLPGIRVQGMPTSSLVARVGFALFAVVVAALVYRNTSRRIDSGEIESAESNLSGRRRKKRR